MVRRLTQPLACGLVVVGLLLASAAWAEPAPESENEAAPAASAAPLPNVEASAHPNAESESEFARALSSTAAQVSRFVAGQLELSVDPKTLFDIDIEDQRAVGIEAERLRRLLQEPAPEGDAGAEPAGTASTAPSVSAAPTSSARPAPARTPAPRSWTRQELRARLELDRARLAFYELPGSKRSELLTSHRKRQAEDRQARAAVQVDEAKQRAAEAERKQLEALEAARTARTEALRLVAEEHARLLGLARQQAERESAFVEARTALEQRQEAVIGWQRQVKEMIARAERGEASPKDVDRLYGSLRGDLRSARDALARALAEVHAPSTVPEPGEDRLSELPEGVPAEEPRAKRTEVAKEARRLRELEATLRVDQMQAYFDEVAALNQQRLALYPYLSSAARADISGFGSKGLDQARAELRQVALTAQHQLSETLLWLQGFAKQGSARNASALTVGLVALEWLLPISLFVWWRRRADATLVQWRKQARDERRKRRIVTPEPIERVLMIVQRVRAPLEWIVLVASIVWLLPGAVQERLEVRLAASVLYWTMGGALVVAIINAWADRQDPRGSRKSQLLTAQIRLRSLRLVGRSVVTVALVLSVSDQLVGKGTIYDWVLSTCWLGAIPITLLLTRWWRPIVLERLGQRRRKTRFVQWVLDKQGWRSLPAALAGGCFLLWEGTVRKLRPRVSSFELSRRVLAYLFRRGMSQRADVAARRYGPLPQDTFHALGPSSPSKEIVASVADEQVADIIRRIDAPGGALFALVGERGAGKTTLLRRIATQANDIGLVQCPVDPALLRSELARAAGLGDQASLSESARAMNAPGRDAGLLFDDAHRLIRPYRGGMAAFDELIAIARQHSNRCSWGFAFDEITWGFLQRTKGARPLFDEVVALEPWHEEGIATLLGRRCREVDINPDFGALLTSLPADADEVERQEAIDSTRVGYHRMIWDYATGNPGIALHTFRRCLGGVGSEIEVKVFSAPDVRELETLPDPAVFVLRAVLQLEYATPKEIAAATLLAEGEILDALRFGVNHGYLELDGERYWVTWAWFRPITRFLERRHLLTF